MNIILKAGRGVGMWRASCAAQFKDFSKTRQSAIIWTAALLAAMAVMLANPDPAYAQNLETFASKVRGLLSSTLLRTLAVIAVIVTGLLWFTGRASTAVLVTVTPQAEIQPRDWRYYVAKPDEIEPMQKICREWAGSTAPKDTEPAVVTTNCRAAAFAKSQLQITN